MTLTAAASLREFFPLCLVLPLRGSATFLAFVPQLEALSESLTHPSLAPSWWWPCLLLRWAFLTLSGYVLSVPSAFSLRRSRWSIPSHCRPSCAVSMLTVSVIGAHSLLRWGVSPCVWFHRSPWGVAVAPPILPYTGPGWSPPICRVPLELRLVFHILLRDVPHVFMVIILSVSLTPACP